MKDWENISDDDLDGLFKEEADKIYPAFEESSWIAMESLLDKGVKGRNLNMLGSVILGLVFLSAISFISYQYVRKSDSFNKKEVSNSVYKGPGSNSVEPESRMSGLKEKVGDSNDETVEKLIGEKDSRIRQSDKEKGKVVSVQSFNSLSNPIEQHISELKTISKKSARESHRENIKVNPEKKQALKSGKINSGENVNRFTEIVADKKNSVEKTDEVKRFYEDFVRETDKKEDLKMAGQLVPEHSESENIVAIKKLTKNIGFLNKSKFKNLEYKEQTRISINGVDKVNTNFSEIESLKQPKVAFRITFSPDFSAVPSNSFFKIGHNIGGLLEYSFNDKLLIQTGVIKSLKYYTANSDSYGWPDSWGQRPSELNLVEARCNMLDIPVNIRYDFSRGGNRWFAQAGFTSYLMLKETYDYIYENSYSSQKWNSWEGKTGLYNAGEFNASFGLERRISKGVSLQVEPFVKIPLAKVGYGNVKLITTGLFFSTKIPLVK